MNKDEKYKLHSIVKCYVIDSIISEILKDKECYRDLSFIEQNTVSGLVKIKRNFHGRIIA